MILAHDCFFHPGQHGAHPPNLGGGSQGPPGLVHLAPECHLVPPSRLAAGPGEGTTPSKPPLAFLFLSFLIFLCCLELGASDWELEGQSQHPLASSGRSASLKGLKHGAIRTASVLDVNLRFVEMPLVKSILILTILVAREVHNSLSCCTSAIWACGGGHRWDLGACQTLVKVPVPLSYFIFFSPSETFWDICNWS